MMSTNTIMLFSLGPWELGLLVLVAFLVFGTRLPEVMRSVGKGINEFKRGLREVEQDSEPTKALDQPDSASRKALDQPERDERRFEEPRERVAKDYGHEKS